MRPTVALTALLALAACGGDASSSRRGSVNPACAAIVADYVAALPAAKDCLAREVCDASRPKPITLDGVPGLGCSTRVTATRAAPLDEILARFDAAGCQELALPCPPDFIETPACGADGRCP
jgi:hypothetical protein